ncbi:MAG: 16S rRNA (uracil(1498)-N(3))-methyltransferase [Paracoccaceae bacterium]|nr:16S rRNA (uracil(1498)-N(3))-methyltransferase [Paracoccaceae bacterium]
MGRVRLYLEEPLGEGQSVSLTRDQAHYLFGVMRLGPEDGLRVFDGVSGEYAATVAEAGKKRGVLSVGARTAPLALPPDLWLLFAPIKKERTDFIVEKAAEMGARRILPVATEYTNTGRVNRERLRSHAVEAAEQCGGTFVPEVAALRSLDRVLADWPEDRRLMFCDEALAGEGAGPPDTPGPWAVLTGPEGGFSDTERARLGGLTYAHPVSLGPRILRADTAVVAALTLWQSRLGDWQ